MCLNDVFSPSMRSATLLLLVHTVGCPLLLCRFRFFCFLLVTVSWLSISASPFSLFVTARLITLLTNARKGRQLRENWNERESRGISPFSAILAHLKKLIALI